VRKRAACANLLVLVCGVAFLSCFAPRLPRITVRSLGWVPPCYRQGRQMTERSHARSALEGRFRPVCVRTSLAVTAQPSVPNCIAPEVDYATGSHRIYRPKSSPAAPT
jgi:hypothetical protein